MILFSRFFKKVWLFIQVFLLFLTGCANRLPEPCLKDGREYCITDEWIFSENWYSCYLRGISCTEGGCWGNARDEFLRAAHKREEDGRWVRTYGMHRLPEYFPNRELGIAYYHLHDFDSALKYLSISLEHCESAKAKYYLNKVRKEKLLLSMEDKEYPQLFLDSYPQGVSFPQLFLSGLAQDDTFVSNILIRVNSEKPLSLMELSRPLFYRFRQRISLKAGINDVLITVVDLLGKKEEERIKILVDPEGPMIYFAKMEAADLSSPVSVRGLLCDPSGVAEFYLNGKKVELIKIETDTPAYSFHYHLSLKEQQRGIIQYRAEDSLKNSTSGSITISTGKQQAGQEQPFRSRQRPVRVAMASPVLAPDNGITPVLGRIAGRRNPDSVRIAISRIPQETFEEEICPQIDILARNRIREVTINGEPILSAYGLCWTEFFNRIIRKYLEGEGEGRFLFSRMIKLKEGENSIHLKVVDLSGKAWEKSFRIIKKTKQIHQLKERWRMAIPYIRCYQPEDEKEQKKEELTYQLIEAFVNQARFKVVELENLPVIIDEKRLCHYLGKPFLGLSSDCRIWIDIFMLGYIQEGKDSLSLSASIVDLETGEILATKDVYEEIDSSALGWQEDTREHAFQICSILAAKFKEHFPLCEGKVISLMGRELKAGICRHDGLKEGMKLLLYRGNLDRDEDFAILTDARVEEVRVEYSLAKLLKDLQDTGIDGALENLGVITK